jgi:hypothetical protein
MWEEDTNSKIQGAQRGAFVATKSSPSDAIARASASLQPGKPSAGEGHGIGQLRLLLCHSGPILPRPKPIQPAL